MTEAHCVDGGGRPCRVGMERLSAMRGYVLLVQSLLRGTHILVELVDRDEARQVSAQRGLFVGEGGWRGEVESAKFALFARSMVHLPNPRVKVVVMRVP